MEEFSREQLTRRREKLKERLKEEKLLALKNMVSFDKPIFHCTYTSVFPDT